MESDVRGVVSGGQKLLLQISDQMDSLKGQTNDKGVLIND